VIPYGRQTIDDDDIAAVVAVMKGEWLTQGPAVDTFEEALRHATGAGFAVAFANGTAALHGAVAAGGLGPGDVLVTSPLTFVASANCARYVGARPRFVDIDADTLNIDTRAVPACDALVAVHYAGLPVDLSGLRTRPRLVIEDASHAIGAMTEDGPVGNCSRSDMCTFSFHPVKTVTTGEGGAVTTNSPALAKALQRFRSHGIVRDPSRPQWWYDVAELGFNYRLSDLHAALGTSQLQKLERFVARRNHLADRYRSALGSLPILLPPAAPVGRRHAYHLFPIRVAGRDALYEGLRAAGIGAQVHYVPVHHFSSFTTEVEGSFPNADRAGAELLSLPLFPALTDEEQDVVIDAVGRLVMQ
jgi:perosamine synthetase